MKGGWSFFKHWLAEQLSFRYAPTQASVTAPIFSQFDIVELAEALALLQQNLSENPQLSTAFKKGEQPSPYRGGVLEYEESRLYQAGDDIRQLNWRLMARTGKAYSKLFQEERQEQWVIVLDRRQAMRFGTHKRLKVTQAMRVAGYYAWLAQQRGFPISGVGVDEQVQQTPIYEGSRSYESLMHDFSVPCPPKKSVVEPPLLEVLKEIQPQLQPGSRLIIVSDFQDLDEETVWLLSSLQSMVKVKAMRVVDPVEQQLPEVSGVALESLTGEATIALTPVWRQRYQQWATRYFQETDLQFKTANVTVKTLLTTDELWRLSALESHADPILSDAYPSNEKGRVDG